jgi:cytidylate kinase
MIISISGNAGSGKSTAAKKLAQALGWPRYYMGGMRREMAAKRGMTIEEYNALGERDDTTDKEVDVYQKELGATQDNFIIEGRTSYYFIPHSFKIFLDVDEKEGARRVFKELQKTNKRNEGENLNTVNDVLESHRRRKDSDMIRYKRYYGIDAYDKKNFDLVIDTTHLTPKQTFGRIMAALYV